MTVSRAFLSSAKLDPDMKDYLGKLLDAVDAVDAVIADVTAGTATASKAAILDANKAIDVVCTASLRLGASGSETAVTATAAELNKLAGAISTNLITGQVACLTTDAIPALTLGGAFAVFGATRVSTQPSALTSIPIAALTTVGAPSFVSDQVFALTTAQVSALCTNNDTLKTQMDTLTASNNALRTMLKNYGLTA